MAAPLRHLWPMRWSQKKQQLEALLAGPLRRRVTYHVARYGPGISSSQARAWVKWDGVEIASMSTAEWENAERRLREQGLTPAEAAGRLAREGVFRRGEFEAAVDTILRSSIEQALQSEDPIVQALACFDRRVGQRRL